MKRQLSLLLLCGFACGIYAQSSLTLRERRNSYRAGDELLKQQVVFRDPGSSGRNLTWDFRNLQIINDEYKLRFFIPDSTRMYRLAGWQHRTLYYFEQRGDSLWAVGYENATTFMEYIIPELRMVFPFTFGDTLRSEFEGRGEYGRRLQLGVRGFTRVEADAEGELILPDERVRRALRVRTTRHYTETDLAHGRETGNQTQMILDTYSWYAQGVRYPVFQSIRTSILSNGADTVVFETSFYFPPSEQRRQTVEEEEHPEDLLSFDDITAVFTEVDLFPNPVVHNLHIRYKLTRNARIHFTVHNNSGILMAQTPQQHLPEGQHENLINMSSLPTGVYTLYVHVDGMVMSLNVVKM